MSLEDFLNDPFDDTPAPGFEDIAMIKIETCWQAWGKGQPSDSRKFFPFYPKNGKKEQYEARALCQQYIDDNRLDGFPQLGFLISIPLDTHLTAHEALTFNIQQFVNSYHSDEQQMGDSGALDDEQQARVTAPMPYNLIVNSLHQFPECFGKYAWARISQEIDQVSQATETFNKNGYPYRVYVVKEIFPDEGAARQAAGLEANVAPKLSATATENKWTVKLLQDNLPKIYEIIKDAEKGENPDQTNYNRHEAVKFACQQYAIETSDLALVEKLMSGADELDEVPF